MRQHHLTGEQRLGAAMLVASAVVIVIVILAALVYGRGRDLASDTPTSLHP